MTSTPNVPGFTSAEWRTPHDEGTWHIHALNRSGELPHREHGIEVCILTVYVDKQESSGTVSMFSLPAAHSSWPKAKRHVHVWERVAAL
jgi:hypothetical protein